MKHEVGKKYIIEGVNLLLEVKGFESYAQRTRKKPNGEDNYIIFLNGYKLDIPESLLTYFIGLHIKNEEAEKLKEEKLKEEKIEKELKELKKLKAEKLKAEKLEKENKNV